MGGLIARLTRWVLTTFGTLIERLIAVGFIQSGVVLAAQTFLALLPLLIVAVAVFPPAVSEAITETMQHRLGLTGASSGIMTNFVNNRDSLRGGISIFGGVVALVSATSFTRALQRVYEASWGLSKAGVRGSLRGLFWLFGLIVYLVVISTAVKLASTVGGTVARPVLLGIGAVLLWWWTPYVLLLGRVRLRALLPSGLITGAVMVVLGVASAIIVPRTVANNELKFGTIGAIFAIESWLVIVSCSLVASAVVGAVVVQLDGPLGRLARGSAHIEGWRRARVPRARKATNDD